LDIAYSDGAGSAGTFEALALGPVFLLSVLVAVEAVLVEAASLGVVVFVAPVAFFAVFFVFVALVLLVSFLAPFPKTTLTPAYSTSSSIGPSSEPAESTASLSSSLGSSSSSYS